MKKYLEILKKTALFSGVGEEDILSMLSCFQATAKDYKKGEYIFSQGEKIENLAIVAKGCVHIQKDDYWGNRTIINVVSEGEMFGESYASQNSGPFLNNAVAAEDSTVLFFNIKKLLGVCSAACRFHSVTVQNLFFAVSEKNRLLAQKLTVISQRSTREKLISYLSQQAKQQNSGQFFIPFNRQQLADYLSVDRSAMSNELCKMRDEGLLSFKKNYFELHSVKEKFFEDN